MHIQASPLTKPPMTAIQPRPPAQLPTPLIGDKQLQQLADAIESDLTQGVECLNSLTGLPAIDEEGNKQYRRPVSISSKTPATTTSRPPEYPSRGSD